MKNFVAHCAESLSSLSRFVLTATGDDCFYPLGNLTENLYFCFGYRSVAHLGNFSFKTLRSQIINHFKTEIFFNISSLFEK